MSAGTETEYLLMVDYQGVGGIFGSESRYMPRGTTEAQALDNARAILRDHAWRVEVFTREVPVDWTKVEELRRSGESARSDGGATDA